MAYRRFAQTRLMEETAAGKAAPYDHAVPPRAEPVVTY
jgi:hypothetical protein